jgi:hypothetical protein
VESSLLGALRCVEVLTLLLRLMAGLAYEGWRVVVRLLGMLQAIYSAIQPILVQRHPIPAISTCEAQRALRFLGIRLRSQRSDSKAVLENLLPFLLLLRAVAMH